mmetsp:Transcript_67899/g.181557  ORF Transcript_67899/g.181557 Transcript_67899/m.181557 type:complete len:86 (-) Transcript_67899:12-269(-)
MNGAKIDYSSNKCLVDYICDDQTLWWPILLGLNDFQIEKMNSFSDNAMFRGTLKTEIKDSIRKRLQSLGCFIWQPISSSSNLCSC